MPSPYLPWPKSKLQGLFVVATGVTGGIRQSGGGVRPGSVRAVRNLLVAGRAEAWRRLDLLQVLGARQVMERLQGEEIEEALRGAVGGFALTRIAALQHLHQ